jgi:hypothetical protein
MLILHIGLQWGGQGKAKTTRNAGRIVGALVGIHFFFLLVFFYTNKCLFIYIYRCTNSYCNGEARDDRKKAQTNNKDVMVVVKLPDVVGSEQELVYN